MKFKLNNLEILKIDKVINKYNLINEKINNNTNQINNNTNQININAEWVNNININQQIYKNEIKRIKKEINKFNFVINEIENNKLFHYDNDAEKKEEFQNKFEVFLDYKIYHFKMNTNLMRQVFIFW